MYKPNISYKLRKRKIKPIYTDLPSDNESDIENFSDDDGKDEDFEKFSNIFN